MAHNNDSGVGAGINRCERCRSCVCIQRVEGDECQACKGCPCHYRRPLRVLSLFAGIGGLDLGLEAHGCRTVAYSEIDPYASVIMTRQFPSAANLGDITTIDWSAVNEQHGPFDIICGGFPCQDISLQGRGGGIEDGERSGLWRYFGDAIRELRPRGVLVENVAALTQRGLDRVLGTLADCGFDAEWECLPASAFGAPHRRDRMFIVAYPVGVGLPRPWEYEPSRHSEAYPYREAGDVVDAVRQGALPYVCRRHDGVPSRLERDRVKALGNAVVPKQAEFVAGILIDRMERVA